MALSVARLQAPVDGEVVRALERFNYVVRYTNGRPAPGELMVREFLATRGRASISDLYGWAVKDPSVPQEQRHRISGLLLGYGHTRRPAL